jgi:hypothetical protein
MVLNSSPGAGGVRLALSPHLGNRVEMTAKVEDFRAIDGHPPFFALLKDVRFQNGEIAAGHLWTRWNTAMFKASVGVGDEISLSARIIKYQRRDGTFDYGIDDVGQIRVALKLRDGRDLSIISNASHMLGARVAAGEVAVRNTDDPRMQAAMLSRFHADPGKHGGEIKVELGPAVALFMLTNSARALGLSLEKYAESLAKAGSGKALLSEHLSRLEVKSGAPPLVLRLQAVSDREVESQRSAEANLRAGKNLLEPNDDDEVVYYKMRWIQSAEEIKMQLLHARGTFVIYPDGVVGALAAWNTDSRAGNSIAEILRLTGAVSLDDRQKLANGLTRYFGDWLRKQRRNELRRTNYLKSQRGSSTTP